MILLDDRAPANVVTWLARLGILVVAAARAPTTGSGRPKPRTPPAILPTLRHLALRYGTGIQDATITDRVVVDGRSMILPQAVIDVSLLAERAADQIWPAEERSVASLPAKGLGWASAATVVTTATGRRPTTSPQPVAAGSQVALLPSADAPPGSSGPRLVVIASRELTASTC